MSTNTSPESFLVAVSKPLPPSVLQSSIHLRKPKQTAMTLPCRSSRLSKKVIRRTPALAAMQNLLMHKLGVSDAD
jgi:hypothetical protein